MINFKIDIAGIIIGFESDDPGLEYEASKNGHFKGFECSKPKEPDVRFRIKYGEAPEFKGKRVLFDIEDNWRVCTFKNKFLYEYPDRNINRIERLVVVNKKLSEGVIYNNRERTPEERKEASKMRVARLSEEQRKQRQERFRRRRERLNKAGGGNRRSPNHSLPEGRAYGAGRSGTGQAGGVAERKIEKIAQNIISGIKENFLQHFLIGYLAKYRKGALVHASCVESRGKAYIFIGRTGAGKSTLAKIWKETANARVFNDERAILKFEHKETYFYNAPWVGEYNEGYQPASEDRLKIDGLFFIYHEKKNTLNPITKREASLKLFQNTFPAFWDVRGMADSLALCAEIAKATPCYELGFVNDERVVEFIREYAGN